MLLEGMMFATREFDCDFVIIVDGMFAQGCLAS